MKKISNLDIHTKRTEKIDLFYEKLQMKYMTVIVWHEEMKHPTD